MTKIEEIAREVAFNFITGRAPNITLAAQVETAERVLREFARDWDRAMNEQEHTDAPFTAMKDTLSKWGVEP